MNDYLRDYDARLRARARELANLHSADEIRAWYIAQNAPIDERDNPFAAALGTLQAVTHELLCLTADKVPADA